MKGKDKKKTEVSLTKWFSRFLLSKHVVISLSYDKNVKQIISCQSIQTKINFHYYEYCKFILNYIGSYQNIWW